MSHCSGGHNVQNNGSFPRTEAVIAYFHSKVAKAESCWLWTGNRVTYAGGKRWHGQLRWEGRQFYAHRFAWFLAHGEIPEGQSVLHRCDVPHCVNPEHLFLGSQADNLKDAAAKGRLHVPRPNRRKVSDAQIAEMLELRQHGLTLSAIAAQFGVSKAFVSHVVNGRRRKAA